jgi:hypothetical protein
VAIPPQGEGGLTAGRQPLPRVRRLASNYQRKLNSALVSLLMASCAEYDLKIKEVENQHYRQLWYSDKDGMIFFMEYSV